ncbi:hypothetical protein H9Q70_014655, partial [Fusarium xylarioides]
TAGEPCSSNGPDLPTATHFKQYHAPIVQHALHRHDAYCQKKPTVRSRPEEDRTAAAVTRNLG